MDLLRLLGAVQRVIGVLCTRQYATVAAITDGGLDANQMRDRLRQVWTGQLAPPPDLTAADVEVLRISDSPPRWRVRMPLWSENRPTAVVVSATVAELADGSPSTTLDDITYEPNYRIAEGAMPQSQIAAVQRFVDERRADTRRETASRSARLRTQPPPGVPAAVGRAVVAVLESITSSRFDELDSLAGAIDWRMPNDVMRDVLAQHGGGWSMPPAGIPHGIEVDPYDAGESEVDVDFLMWRGDIQTDLRLYLYLRRRSDHEYDVVVTDLRIR
jgi:hypothetical protein